MILLGYSEQCFNIAEAINLGWIEGDADAYYKSRYTGFYGILQS